MILFAEIPRVAKIVPVIKSADGKRYQVSWAEEVARASTGDHVVRLFDASGYASLLKARESGSAEASPLVTLTVNHPGTYKGPLVPLEFLAVFGIVVVGYTAVSAKSKIYA